MYQQPSDPQNRILPVGLDHPSAGLNLTRLQPEL